MIAARVVGATQFAVGTLMLVTPTQVARAAAGPEVASGGAVAPPTIVRVLGLRTATQGALTVIRPSRTSLEVGAGTDALHLLSMIALAAVAPKYRRSALVSAAVATASLAGSLGARS